MQRISVVRETQSLRRTNASFVNRLSQVVQNIESKKVSARVTAVESENRMTANKAGASAPGQFKLDIKEEDKNFDTGRESLINKEETEQNSGPLFDQKVVNNVE